MSDADDRSERPAPRSPYLTPATATSAPTPTSPATSASPPAPATEPTVASAPSAPSAADPDGSAEPTEAAAADPEGPAEPTAYADVVEPGSPGETAGAAEPAGQDESPEVASVFPTAAGSPPVRADQKGRDEEPQHLDRNWMGVAAFIAGALLVSIVAIVLGHMGLAAAKRGRANNRAFSLAGLILGYLGLALTAAGAWLLLGEQTSAADIDVRAQQDVTAVGAAAAEYAIATGQVPSVGTSDGAYTVADETIAAQLEVPHELTFTGAGPADWCVQIDYEGGENDAFSYTAVGGLNPGQCPEAS